MHKNRPAWYAAIAVSCAIMISCSDPRGFIDISTNPGDVARQELRLVHVHEKTFASATETDASSDIERLMSADALARALYPTCVDELFDADGPGLNGTPTRQEFSEATNACPNLSPGHADYLPQAPTSCPQAHCLAQAATCVAHHMVEIAAEVQPFDARRLASGDGTIYNGMTVPPQSPEADAYILEVALRWAELAGTTAAENLRSSLGRYFDYRAGRTVALESQFNRDFPGLCTFASLETSVASSINYTGDPLATPLASTIGESLAYVLVDSRYTAQEAGLGAAQRHEAIADSEFSKNASQLQASRRAWIDPIFSRARGAHILVGGSNLGGLAGVQDGFCPYANPTDAVRRAMQIIRPTGISLAGLSTGAMVVDAVAQYQLSAYEPGSMPSPLSLDDVRHAILDVSGLTEDDYLQAARQIMSESVAFWRDNSIKIGLDGISPFDDRLAAIVTPISSGELLPQISLYRIRATAVLDSSIPPNSAEFGGVVADANGQLMRFAPFQDDRAPGLVTPVISGATIPGYAMPPSHRYAIENLSNYLDYAASVAHDLVGQQTATYIDTQGGSEANKAAARSATNLLTSVVASWNRERTGRIVTCRGDGLSGSSTTTNLGRTVVIQSHFGSAAESSQAAQDLAFVAGIDGLRCVTQGHIHGANCNPSDYVVHASGATVVSGVQQYTGFDQAIRLDLSLPTQTPNNAPVDPRWFLIRLRRNEAGLAAAPNRYDAVGEVELFFASPAESTHPFCHYTPINPVIDAIAIDLVTPSELSCTRPATTCNGIDVAQAIPLEDELTDDSNGVESSWRYYLTQARAAATAADTLGQNVIDTGLQVEERVELAAQEVQSVCGADVDINWMAGLTQSSAASAPCMNEGERQTFDANVVHVCTNGRWLPDAIATIDANAPTDANSAALKRCLGSDSVEPFVSLGAQKLCVWTDLTTGDMCAGASEQHPCPFQQPDPSGCSLAPGSASEISSAIGGHAIQLHSVKALGLFQDVTDQRSRGDLAERPCNGRFHAPALAWPSGSAPPAVSRASA